MGSVLHQDGYILVAKLVEWHYQRHENCVFELQQQSISKTYMHTTVRFDQHEHCMTCSTYTHVHHSILQVHTTCDL